MLAAVPVSILSKNPVIHVSYCQQSKWFDHCPPQSVLAGNFSQICHSHMGQLVDHRLCLMQEKSNTTILGVDFSDCNLSTFPADFPKPGVQFV
ncbi:hypothetical protein FBUS_04196 [Fasciolopsis buskii]|uniref:Uncharacterized protein n=1 Tax=Fasciolopsis buskii TaxID=27845 RepID=A0A8E0S2Z7_9TREM|nr:hypothetical protein FBUS_04196 [Fasciolopsis buski]